MIQNGKREKRFFILFTRKENRFEKKGTEKSKIIFETIYGYSYLGNIIWKYCLETLLENITWKHK